MNAYLLRRHPPRVSAGDPAALTPLDSLLTTAGNDAIRWIPRLRPRGMTRWGLPFTFCLLTFALPLNAATIYYVSNAANDSTNNGTSTTTPWKTILKVQNSLGSLRGGDS